MREWRSTWSTNHATIAQVPAKIRNLLCLTWSDSVTFLIADQPNNFLVTVNELRLKFTAHKMWAFILYIAKDQKTVSLIQNTAGQSVQNQPFLEHDTFQQRLKVKHKVQPCHISGQKPLQLSTHFTLPVHCGQYSGPLARHERTRMYHSGLHPRINIVNPLRWTPETSQKVF